MRRTLWTFAALSGAFWAVLPAQNPQSPIHFKYRPIDFRLDSSETPQRHAPETMAGGVAVFDYNNDGYLDLYFTNGADIATLKKSAAKYSNRLFENDGHGNFKDVTEKAGLAGAGFDNGVAIGDYDNDGYKAATLQDLTPNPSARRGGSFGCGGLVFHVHDLDAAIDFRERVGRVFQLGLAVSDCYQVGSGDTELVHQIALDRVGGQRSERSWLYASPPAASVWPATTKVEPFRSGFESARPKACTDDIDLALMFAEL